MKTKIYIIAACVLGLVAGSLLNPIKIGASGTPADPLVTKSYVDAKFQELAALLGASGNPVVSGGDTFTPVFLNQGDVLIGHEGTEIILRSGKAVGYVRVENGIANVTTGTEIFDGAAVGINHLLIVPKQDARGIRATTDAWLIVKGGFGIMN